MSTTARPMTAEDLCSQPDDGMLHELVRGELRTMTPAGFEHGAVGVNFIIHLGAYVKQHALGIVVGPDTGFIVAHEPDTVRAADVAFVRQDRMPEERPVKFWPGAPDLAVEVLSPSDTAFAVDEKVQGWLDAGTVEVIVINPKLKTVKLIRAAATGTILRLGDVLEDLQSVPGFRCAVEEIFA